MGKPQKKKKKKKGLNPKLVVLLTELIRDPGKLGGASDDLAKFGATASELDGPLSKAHAISEDPDDAGNFESFDELPFAVKVALIDLMATEGAVGFIARLQRDVEDKGIAKAVGAAANRLRADGMDVPDLKERSSISFDAVSEGPPKCYATAIDGEGNRVVVIAKPGNRGLSVFYALCGDSEGLQHLEGVAMPRGGYRRFVRTIEAQVNARMIPVEVDHALWLLDEARQISADAGNPVPPAYTDSKAVLMPPVDYEAPIWGRIVREEVEGNAELLGKSGELHDLHEFVAWAPDPAGLEILMDELGELKDASREEEEEAQTKQIDAAVIKAVDAHFDDKQRHRYSRRLEENALVLLDTDRDEEARICAATCLAIRDTKTEPSSIDFLTKMFDKVAGNVPALEMLQQAAAESAEQPAE